MRVREFVLTVEMAHRLLAVNDHNRNVRVTGIMRWKGIFLRDEYLATGEGLKVLGTLTDPRRLQDGQHRLLGYLAAKEERPDLPDPTCFVVEGVTDEAQVVIDTGMKRSPADVLRWRGETNTTLLASLINLSLRVESGRLIGRGGTFTNQQYLAELDARPYLRDGIAPGRRFAKKFKVSPTGCAFACATMTDAAGGGFVDQFVDELTIGVFPNPDYPLLHLDNMLNDWSQRKGHGGAGPLAHAVAASIIKAWNCWRGEEFAVKKEAVRWPGRRNTPEPFPKAT